MHLSGVHKQYRGLFYFHLAKEWMHFQQMTPNKNRQPHLSGNSHQRTQFDTIPLMTYGQPVLENLAIPHILFSAHPTGMKTAVSVL